MLVISPARTLLRRLAPSFLAGSLGGLALVGAGPAMAVAADEEPRIVVESAELSGASSLGTWFGAAPESVLELVLYNNGQAPTTPSLELAWRDGGSDPQKVAVPPVGEIAPGTQVTVEVPVRFDGLSQGEHTVSGVVRDGELESPVEATTSFVPWGLYGFLVVLLLAGSALRTRWVMTQMDREDRQSLEVRPDEAPAEVEARALATMERFADTREAQRAAGEPPAVPQQRAPGGGKRAARPPRASGPWLTRR